MCDICAFMARPGQEEKLTRERVDALVHGLLVAAGCGAEGLVAGGEGDDEEEGDDEAASRADVPLAEDDAKVVCVPGEEHLRGTWEVSIARACSGGTGEKPNCWQQLPAVAASGAAMSTGKEGEERKRRTLMLQRSPMPPPIPP